MLSIHQRHDQYTKIFRGIRLFKKFILFILIVSSSVSFAQKREIAITIDDLPFVGESKNFHLDMIINTLKSNEIPAIGFVIAKEVAPNNWEMLNKFRESGFDLGNHTLTHANLSNMSAEAYISNIETADQILSKVLSRPKYFRYPYLSMGEGQKKAKVLKYLASKNYQIAPISIDSKDFVFNQLLLAVPEKDRRNFLAALKHSYLDFIWLQTLKAEEQSKAAQKPDEAQILLIHANLLNAYVLPDIINLYKQNGFTFISLNDALKSSRLKIKLQKPEEKQINLFSHDLDTGWN